MEKSWFYERIGKKVLCVSRWWGYNRIIKITNRKEALRLWIFFKNTTPERWICMDFNKHNINFYNKGKSWW